jgi:hypothetical protein
VRHRIAAFAIVLTAVLAACGTTGDDESEDRTTTTAAKTTTTTGSSSTTETSAPEDDDAQARAEAVDITVDELPAGWDSTTHEEDPDDNLVTQCSDFDVDDLSLATYFTDDFTFGDLEQNEGQQISVGTRVFEDESTATDVLDVIPTDDFMSCVNDTVKTSFGGSVEGELTARELDTSADQTEGFSGQLTLSSGSTGETLDVTLAFVAIRNGDLVTGMTGFALGQDLDADVIDTLANRIVELQEA